MGLPTWQNSSFTCNSPQFWIENSSFTCNSPPVLPCGWFKKRQKVRHFVYSIQVTLARGYCASYKATLSKKCSQNGSTPGALSWYITQLKPSLDHSAIPYDPKMCMYILLTATIISPGCVMGLLENNAQRNRVSLHGIKLMSSRDPPGGINLNG